MHRIPAIGIAEEICRDYARLLAEAPIDIVCLGIGVNGHIAFNDPPVADFDDPAMVKVVELDETCRQQQVDDSCFAALAEVPKQAITLTVPQLMAAQAIFCVVPGPQKRGAVKAALDGPMSTNCPASILRTHPNCKIFLDREASPVSKKVATLADRLCETYLNGVVDLMRTIHEQEKGPMEAAARRMAEQIASDRLIHIFGPGGHSNLASQELFFRAGGLMHINAILDEGTLLSNGALRSMAIERTPGYGKVVIEDQRLGDGDLLILANAYGINSALIDAALTARERGVFVIGVSSRTHADQTAPEHPARHPSRQNLHDIVDISIDTKVPIGDAIIEVPGVSENTSAVSTFANAFALNSLVIRTIAHLGEMGEDPYRRSGNAPGGDEANGRFLEKFREGQVALTDQVTYSCRGLTTGQALSLHVRGGVIASIDHGDAAPRAAPPIIPALVDCGERLHGA